MKKKIIVNASCIELFQKTSVHPPAEDIRHPGVGYSQQGGIRIFSGKVHLQYCKHAIFFHYFLGHLQP